MTKLFALEAPPHTRGELITEVTGETVFPKHPRIRGERAEIGEHHTDFEETPPHTRGKLGCSVGTVHRETPPHTRGKHTKLQESL